MFTFGGYFIVLCSIDEWFLKGCNILAATFVPLSGLNWPTNPNEQAKTFRPNIQAVIIQPEE